MYGVMNCSLLMLYLVAFDAKLNNIYIKNLNFILRWKFLSVYTGQSEDVQKTCTVTPTTFLGLFPFEHLSREIVSTQLP